MVDYNFGYIANKISIHDDLIKVRILKARTKHTLEETVREILNSMENKYNTGFSQRYIGEIVIEAGFKPEQQKISGIQNLVKPGYGEDIQRLLGMTNFVAKSISNN